MVFHKSWVYRFAVLVLLAALTGMGCMPKSMQVRTGNDPRYQDDDVRFRTVYYFRVFEYCEDKNNGTPKKVIQKDNLYRFLMTGKGSSLWNDIHFESGTLQQSQIDPFGALLSYDEDSRQFYYKSTEEIAMQNRQKNLELVDEEFKQLIDFRNDNKTHLTGKIPGKKNKALEAALATLKDAEVKITARRAANKVIKAEDQKNKALEAALATIKDAEVEKTAREAADNILKTEGNKNKTLEAALATIKDAEVKKTARAAADKVLVAERKNQVLEAENKENKALEAALATIKDAKVKKTAREAADKVIEAENRRPKDESFEGEFNKFLIARAKNINSNFLKITSSPTTSSKSVTTTCSDSSPANQEFWILGPEGWRKFDQDERLALAMSSSGKPLISAMKEISGRLLNEKSAASGNETTPIKEWIKADKALDKFKSLAADTVGETIDDAIETLKDQKGDDK